jgi:hypothetical protein
MYLMTLDDSYFWNKNNGPDEMLKTRFLRFEDEIHILKWRGGKNGFYESEAGFKFDKNLNFIGF